MPRHNPDGRPRPSKVQPPVDSQHTQQISQLKVAGDREKLSPFLSRLEGFVRRALSRRRAKRLSRFYVKSFLLPFRSIAHSTHKNAHRYDGTPLWLSTVHTSQTKRPCVRYGRRNLFRVDSPEMHCPCRRPGRLGCPKNPNSTVTLDLWGRRKERQDTLLHIKCDA